MKLTLSQIRQALLHGRSLDRADILILTWYELHGRPHSTVYMMVVGAVEAVESWHRLRKNRGMKDAEPRWMAGEDCEKLKDSGLGDFVAAESGEHLWSLKLVRVPLHGLDRVQGLPDLTVGRDGFAGRRGLPSGRGGVGIKASQGAMSTQAA